MRSQSSDRTGILILRLWLEGEAREGFRARITQTLDSTDGQHATATAGDAEDVYDAVRTWVEAFVDQAELSSVERIVLEADTSSDARVTR